MSTEDEHPINSPRKRVKTSGAVTTLSPSPENTFLVDFDDPRVVSGQVIEEDTPLQPDVAEQDKFNCLLGNRSRVYAIPPGPYAPTMGMWYCQLPSLKPGQMLDHAFVDNYCAVLCNQFNNNNNHSTNPTTQALYVSHLQSTFEISPGLRNSDVFNRHQLLFSTIWINGNHFALVVINRTNRKIFLVDSFSNTFAALHNTCGECRTRQQIVMKLLKMIDAVLCERNIQVFEFVSKKMFPPCRNVFSGKSYDLVPDGGKSGGGHGGGGGSDEVVYTKRPNFRLFCVVDIPAQKDGTSCGAFTALYLKLILNWVQSMLLLRTNKPTTTTTSLTVENPVIRNCTSISALMHKDTATNRHALHMRYHMYAEFYARANEVHRRVLAINDSAAVRADTGIIYSGRDTGDVVIAGVDVS